MCTGMGKNSNDTDTKLKWIQNAKCDEKIILIITVDQKSLFAKKHIMHFQGYLHPLITTKK